MRYQAQITNFSGKIRNHSRHGNFEDRNHLQCFQITLLLHLVVFMGCIPISNFFFFLRNCRYILLQTQSHFSTRHSLQLSLGHLSVYRACNLTFALQGHQREVTPPVNPVQTPATFIALFDGFKQIHNLADVT